MNKTAIKNFAIWARVQLIEAAKQRAYEYEITEKGENKANLDTVAGRLLTSDEKQQRQQLIEQIRRKGYAQVMEEAAYTWFNRFIALRFMEVNGFLPSKVRLFTDENGAFKPEIMKEAMTVEIDGLDRAKVLDLLDKQNNEELYKYLLITQCNALNGGLPYMFEKISNWTELLFPANLLRPDSVVGQMVSDIPEEDWTDTVQIIGWMYQYYNTELKDDTFALLKKNVKITKERIPSATQLFTPDWIVRYMVENSLGRIFIDKRKNEGIFADGHGADEMTWEESEAKRIANEKYIAEQMGWKYYLPEAEQTEEVRQQLDKIQGEYANLDVKEIKVIDPCMGSGHILVYAFDVLMQIYEANGYSQRDAAQSILENNLYGLDIDDRAAQLAYFAVMMKARQYDRRIFSRGIQPHVYAIVESNGLDRSTIEYFTNNDPKLEKDFGSLVNELRDAKEYGSILNISQVDYTALYARIDEVSEDISIFREVVLSSYLPLIQVAEVMARKYDVVVTNPPYMGSNGMSNLLSEYVAKNYPDSKTDMFSVFTEKCRAFSQVCGLYGMITQPSILFLSSFEKLRKKIVDHQSISTLLHMGRGIFGIDFGSTAFVIRNVEIKNHKAHYFRLHERTFQYIDPDDIKELYLKAAENHSFMYDFSEYDTQSFEKDALCEEEYKKITPRGQQRLYFSAIQDNFGLFPGTPIAYWASKSVFSALSSGKTIRDVATPCEGIKTGDNERFLRYWHEVDALRTTIFTSSQNAKWYKHAKGGPYRRWYGNLEYVINWTNNGSELKQFKKSTVSNENLFFTDAITWSYISAGKISMRTVGNDVLYNNKGPACYCPATIKKYLLGLSNSVVFNYILAFWAATMDFKPGNISAFPYIEPQDTSLINDIVGQCVEMSKCDWDSFETSWDFKKHPLV